MTSTRFVHIATFMVAGADLAQMRSCHGVRVSESTSETVNESGETLEPGI
jgi:hypothetical protein